MSSWYSFNIEFKNLRSLGQLMSIDCILSSVGDKWSTISFSFPCFPCSLFSSCHYLLLSRTNIYTPVDLRHSCLQRTVAAGRLPQLHLLLHRHQIASTTNPIYLLVWNVYTLGTPSCHTMTSRPTTHVQFTLNYQKTESLYWGCTSYEPQPT